MLGREDRLAGDMKEILLQVTDVVIETVLDLSGPQPQAQDLIVQLIDVADRWFFSSHVC